MRKISLLISISMLFNIGITAFADETQEIANSGNKTEYIENFDGTEVPFDITSVNSESNRKPLALAMEDDEKATDGKTMTCKANGILSGTATVTIPFGKEINTSDNKIEIIARIKPIYLFGTTASTNTSQKYFYERLMQINGTKDNNKSNLYSIYNASWGNDVWLLDWKTRADKHYPALWGKESTVADFPENPEYVTYKYTIDGENNECTISYSNDEVNYTDMLKYKSTAMLDTVTSMSIGTTYGMSYAIDYVKVTSDITPNVSKITPENDMKNVPQDSEVNLDFNCFVNPESVNKENICVYNQSGAQLSEETYNVEYINGTENDSARITFEQLLNEGETYTVQVKNITRADDETKIMKNQFESKFTVLRYYKIETPQISVDENTVNITSDIVATPQQTGLRYMTVVGYYAKDENGKIYVLDRKVEGGSFADGEQTIPVKVSFEYKNTDNCSQYVKILLWNGLGELKRYTESVYKDLP